MTALDRDRAERSAVGVQLVSSTHQQSATMTARKLKALIDEGGADAERADRQAGEGRSDDPRAPLNIAELSATALPTSSRPTSSMAKDWRTGMSTALAQPEQDRQDQDHPDLDEAGDRQDGEDRRARTIITTWVPTRVCALGQGVRGDAGEQAQDHDRHELGRGHDAEPDRVAGQLEDEPRLGDLLHPRPDERDGLAAEEQPVVAMAECASCRARASPRPHGRRIAPDHGSRAPGAAAGRRRARRGAGRGVGRRVSRLGDHRRETRGLGLEGRDLTSTRARASRISDRRSSGSWVVLSRSRLRSRAVRPRAAGRSAPGRTRHRRAGS